MISRNKTNPVILTLSAHDPSGAAGIQADIEAITYHHCQSVSVITGLTTQNTGHFESILPQNPLVFRNQADLLLADVEISACKIGLIGSELLVNEISNILSELEGIPVVLDPILHSGTGKDLAADDVKSEMLEKLVPKTTVLTPNVKEAIKLSGKPDMHEAANVLLAMGCNSVLITGADQSTEDVVNVLYIKGKGPMEFVWKRLKGTYHGSGCTLAASVSAGLALGKDIESAVKDAQAYTYNTLKQARQIGRSQLHPTRNLI